MEIASDVRFLLLVVVRRPTTESIQVRRAVDGVAVELVRGAQWGQEVALRMYDYIRARKKSVSTSKIYIISLLLTFQLLKCTN